MYQLKHSPTTGKILSILRLSDSAFIPMAEGNRDYQAFIKWNSEQVIPLDLNSTIEVPKPEPARDLAAEIDALKTQMSANTVRLETQELKTENLEVKLQVVDKLPLEL